MGAATHRSLGAIEAFPMHRRSRSLLLVAAAGVVAAFSGPAEAQPWALGRQGPGLRELFAIDQTGETGWLYGQEDLAGDGLATFRQQEQSIDIRTAYAAS